MNTDDFRTALLINRLGTDATLYFKDGGSYYGALSCPSTSEATFFAVGTFSFYVAEITSISFNDELIIRL